jgi:hypothetical protein
MESPFDPVHAECRRLATELVNRIIDLGSDGAGFPVSTPDGNWWVVVEPVEGRSPEDHPRGLLWDQPSS